MRGHVTETKPPADDGTLEELRAEAGPTAPAIAPRTVEAAPAFPSSLVFGRDGDIVVSLLRRASRMTLEEIHGLERAATSRWTPAPMPLLGGVAATRAVAVLRGRREGRATAIGALDRAIEQLAATTSWRMRRVATLAVATAGTAILMDDLLEPDEFEVLFGPWRAAVGS